MRPYAVELAPGPRGSPRGVESARRYGWSGPRVLAMHLEVLEAESPVGVHRGDVVLVDVEDHIVQAPGSQVIREIAPGATGFADFVTAQR